MSYAFDNDCANTAKYEEMAAEYWATVPDYFRQGEALNEAARVCIEAGAFDVAQKLYLRGQAAGLKEPNISPARIALWKFRTEHALASVLDSNGVEELTPVTCYPFRFVGPAPDRFIVSAARVN